MFKLFEAAIFCLFVSCLSLTSKYNRLPATCSEEESTGWAPTTNMVTLQSRCKKIFLILFTRRFTSNPHHHRCWRWGLSQRMAQSWISLPAKLSSTQNTHTRPSSTSGGNDTRPREYFFHAGTPTTMTCSLRCAVLGQVLESQQSSCTWSTELRRRRRRSSWSGSTTWTTCGGFRRLPTRLTGFSGLRQQFYLSIFRFSIAINNEFAGDFWNSFKTRIVYKFLPTLLTSTKILHRWDTNQIYRINLASRFQLALFSKM